MTEEYINWLFSATAQSISAFIAFLLTGYALVYTMMQSIQEKDDSLEEIHLSLKKTYHRRLTYLSIITGLAIIMSLLMIYLNPIYFKEKRFLMLVTSIMSVGALIGGISFVISIINPAKYEKAAKTVLKEYKAELSLTEKKTSSYIFFDEFRSIESLIREYLRKHDLYMFIAKVFLECFFFSSNGRCVASKRDYKSKSI